MTCTSTDPVRQVPVPPAARALSTLSHIDYADAFLVDVGPSRDRTAEQWVRAILEDAPLDIRTALLSGWSALGLKLDTHQPRSVLGWQLRTSTRDFVLLGADSRVGMPGELLLHRRRDTLLFATFVQHDNRAASAMWASVQRVHIRAVRYVLERASHRPVNDPR
jgi:hypothetical protein